MIRINPVYKKELKVSVRTVKTSFIILIYNSLLALIGLLAFYSYYEAPATYGGTINYGNILVIYTIISLIQFALIFFIVPAITSSAISGERERQTLEILLTTKLRPIQIIIGKLMSSISTILLLVISSFPILSIVFAIGGIRITDLIQVILIALVIAIFVGSIGIFYSTLFKKTTIATIFTYGTIIVILGGTVFVLAAIYLIVQMRLEANYNGIGAYPKADLGNLIFILLINPIFTLIQLFLNQFGSDSAMKVIIQEIATCNQFVLDNWFIISIAVQMLLALILILLAAKVLNPLKKKDKAKKYKKRKKKRKENNSY